MVDAIDEARVPDDGPPTKPVAPNDRPVAVLLLLAQCLLLMLGYGIAQLSTLDDSHCSVRPGDGYADCGDPAWPHRAAMTGVIGGGVLLVLTAGWIAWATARGRASRPIAICFLALQIMLVCVTTWMAARFGPA